MAFYDLEIFPVVFEVNCGRMEEQALGINLLQELGFGSSNQLSRGEKPLQFVLPFSSFSCPGLLALLPWETVKCKVFEMLEIGH